MHLLDSENTFYNNETSTITPFGDGVVDFDMMLPAIVDAGYDSEWWPIDLYGWTDALSYTERCKKWLGNKFVELRWVLIE